jgi:hypothetical protein
VPHLLTAPLLKKFLDLSLIAIVEMFTQAIRPKDKKTNNK